MKVSIVDPSAYTPPYDHALCSALGRLGVEVQLLTSRFPYGPTPAAEAYVRRDLFYRRSHARTATGPRSRPALAGKLAEHVPGMLAARRELATVDVAHYQWLPVQPLDIHLLPRRRAGSRRPARVLTAHDVLPREPRPGQLRAQRRLYERFDAIVVHSQHGRTRLIEELGVPADRVHAIPHGAFSHLAEAPESPKASESPKAPESPKASESRHERAGDPEPPFRSQGPVVLFFGLLRPYKGLDVLLDAWRRMTPEQRGGAELWVAGMARMDVSALPLRQEGVRAELRFVGESELPAYFRRADLVVLPYREIDQSGVLFTALAFGRPLLLSDVGGFPEIASTGAAETFPSGDPEALRAALVRLLADEPARRRMSAAALAAASGPFSWDSIARAHLRLYESLL